MKENIITLILILLALNSCARHSTTRTIPIKGEDVLIYVDIEKAIERPDEVLALNLSGQSLYKLPGEIYELSELKYLNLSSNMIKSIPDSISLLTKLETLILHDNALVDINSKINELKYLQNLVLSDNNLSRLPSGLFELKQLKKLVLLNNNFYYDQIIEIKQMLPNTLVMVYME